jgi:hypothetical protein
MDDLGLPMATIYAPPIKMVQLNSADTSGKEQSHGQVADRLTQLQRRYRSLCRCADPSCSGQEMATKKNLILEK